MNNREFEQKLIQRRAWYRKVAKKAIRKRKLTAEVSICLDDKYANLSAEKLWEILEHELYALKITMTSVLGEVALIKEAEK